MQEARVVSFYKTRGINVMLSSDGVIATDANVSESVKRKLDETIREGLENILEGWIIEGIFIKDTFYVKYIVDESKKCLGIDETISWAKIIGYSVNPIKRRCCLGEIKDAKKEEIRPELDFDNRKRGNLVLEFMSSGKEIKKTWREKIQEVCNGL